MNVSGLPSGQGLDCRNDMAIACLQRGPYHSGGPGPRARDWTGAMIWPSPACGEGHIIPAVQALARGQSINQTLTLGKSINSGQGLDRRNDMTFMTLSLSGDNLGNGLGLYEPKIFYCITC